MQKTTPAPAPGAPTRHLRRDNRCGQVRADPAPAAALLKLTLSRGSIHWVHRPVGRTVVCDSGTLWLRFDAALPGVVLEGGQSHHCAVGSALTILALSAAQARFG